jgi:hypothetical protein
MVVAPDVPLHSKVGVVVLTTLSGAGAVSVGPVPGTAGRFAVVREVWLPLVPMTVIV